MQDKMKPKNKFFCMICDLSYSSKNYLTVHENSIHRNVKFDCKDCGKQFGQKPSLNRHIKSIHKGMKYKCNQCEREFKHVAQRARLCFIHQRALYLGGIVFGRNLY